MSAEDPAGQFTNLFIQTAKNTIIIIIDNFCIALFSGVPKLTALYNILQHFLSFTNLKPDTPVFVNTFKPP